MAKIDNRSANMALLTAEQELLIPPGTEMMGARAGGFSLSSDVFKRGYGDDVFGNNSQGSWWGKADFDGAPASVDYAGNATFTSITIAGYLADGEGANDINTHSTKVSGLKLVDLSITATQISDNSISTPKLQANSITANKIVANTITSAEIASNTITANEISSGTITANEIASSTITANEITGNSLSAIYADLGTITAGTINGVTFNSGYSGGGFNVYGNTFSIKTSGGLETGRIFATGYSLRIEATSNGTIQTNAYLNFDNTSGTGINIPGTMYAIRDSRVSFDKDSISLNGKTLYVKDTSVTTFRDSSGRGAIGWSGAGELKVDASGKWFQINGNAKEAVVPTSKGHNALYCAEAPEVWFFDFVDSKDDIDPLFLEVTEGKMKWIKTEDGYQVWRRRKGHAHKRFEFRTSEQFLQNERFLSLAKKK